MRYLVFGDTHGSSIWKEIIEIENFDKLIFLGDYLSSRDYDGITQINNFEEILKYKESNPDKVILLRGNHDMQHLGYSWAECSGMFTECLPWCNANKDRILNNTQWIYYDDKFLFAHAGISQTWFNSLNINSLDDINNLPPSEKFGFTPDHYGDQYGDSVTQPCTWIRPLTLIRDMYPGRIQVVGHTRVIHIRYNDKNNLCLCDNIPYQYLIIDDGKLEIKDSPIIPLTNRYDHIVYLVKETDNSYRLEASDFAMEFCSVSYNNDSDKENGIYHSIDPSGGPFICIGETLNGMIVKSIVWENGKRPIITFENED